MQSALGRANIVIECHCVKLVTLISAAEKFTPLLWEKIQEGRDRN